MQRATSQQYRQQHQLSISIHALYAEGDQALQSKSIELERISIHALYAEGDAGKIDGYIIWMISIHALYAEGDGYQRGIRLSAADFNPRPLCRGRHNQ